MPLVSVIIRVYNRIKYLPLAIHSVLNQTLQDFEIIVIDDGSEEDVLKIVNRFNDQRIKYIKNEKNYGHTIALKKGLEISKGKYIAVLDSDDMFLPNNLYLQYTYLERYQDSVISACGRRYYINRWNTIIGYPRKTFLYNYHQNRIYNLSVASISKNLKFGWRYITSSSIMFSNINQNQRFLNEVIEKYNDYYYSDLIFYLKMLTNKAIFFHNNVISMNRAHCQNVSLRYWSKGSEIDEVIDIIRKEKFRFSLISLVSLSYRTLRMLVNIQNISFPDNSNIGVFIVRIFKLAKLFFNVTIKM